MEASYPLASMAATSPGLLEADGASHDGDSTVMAQLLYFRDILREIERRE